MGYSYAMKAGYTLDAIRNAIGGETTNAMPDGGFWETGRENGDGAITGTVWKLEPDRLHVVRRGSFRIEATGKVARFPGLPVALAREAEKAGEAQYRTRFSAAGN